MTEFDGRTIPFDDGTFDAVTFVDVLHHTDDATVLLREAARVASTAVVIKDHLADGFLAKPDPAGHGLGRQRQPRRGASVQLLDAARNGTPPSPRWASRSQGSVTDLGLYAPPLSWACDRQLHVVWRLAPGSSGPERSG